jgi:diguanylate cyclase (GGDEF)-like protein
MDVVGCVSCRTPAWRGVALELRTHVELSQDLPVVSVLLVDDRLENLDALEVSLEPLGQRLVRATSGSEALRAVLDEEFAVILMDISMPELDGFETVAMLRQRERSRHIPIIFLSAYPEQHNVMRSYSAGAVDYILKPFDPDVLRSKVSVFVHLRQHEIALKQAHAELEQRVLERTAELAAANRALEREIIERKAAEHRLFELAHHDGLTGLANRALLMTHLNRAVAQWKRKAERSFAVMMIDLDRFKDINDTLGHHAGDQLLAGFSQRLELCLREVDTAARLGGDEFAVLVDGVTDIGSVTRLAERIQHELAQPFMIDGTDVMSTASIGIVMMNSGYRRGEDLLRDADAAMYRAKEAGRARYRVFGASAITRTG